MPSLDFSPSCCDGGQCADSPDSAQPCGCDPKAQWLCDAHKQKIGRDDRNPPTGYYQGKVGPLAFPQSSPAVKEFLRNTPPRGIGGAPTRASTLPTDAAERKKHPVATGVLDYFPDAIVAISKLSWQGNEQHNPGKPLHWDRSKSADEADTMMRHFLQRGTLDEDGIPHTVKMAWRALALLQKELEGQTL